MSFRSGVSGRPPPEKFCPGRSRPHAPRRTGLLLMLVFLSLSTPEAASEKREPGLYSGKLENPGRQGNHGQQIEIPDQLSRSSTCAEVEPKAAPRAQPRHIGARSRASIITPEKAVRFSWSWWGDPCGWIPWGVHRQRADLKGSLYSGGSNRPQ